MPRKYAPKRAPIRTLVQDSSPAGLNAQGRVALFAFLLREFGDKLSHAALRNLHRECLDATLEASAAITAGRGCRVDRISGKRIGASRHAVRVYAYVLVCRVRAALTAAGLARPGMWGASQARGARVEGLVYSLARECAQLAGVALPQNLDRIRQGAAGIAREAFEIPPHKHVSAV